MCVCHMNKRLLTYLLTYVHVLCAYLLAHYISLRKSSSIESIAMNDVRCSQIFDTVLATAGLVKSAKTFNLSGTRSGLSGAAGLISVDNAACSRQRITIQKMHSHYGSCVGRVTDERGRRTVAVEAPGMRCFGYFR